MEDTHWVGAADEFKLAGLLRLLCVHCAAVQHHHVLRPDAVQMIRSGRHGHGELQALSHAAAVSESHMLLL